MTAAREKFWRFVVMILICGTVVGVLAAGRSQVELLLQELRSLGPALFFTVFALVISFGVPPTPFLLTAGAAFSPKINVVGFVIGYTISLAIAYGFASRLFKARLDSFMEGKFPFLAATLQKNAVITTLVVRLTPGFPYVLQNCFLVSICRNFPAFLLVSLPPLLFMSFIFAYAGKSLIEGRYPVLVGLIAFVLLVGMVWRRIARAPSPNPPLAS